MRMIDDKGHVCVHGGGGYDLPLPCGERAPTWRRLYCVYDPPGYTKWSLISNVPG